MLYSTYEPCDGCHIFYSCFSSPTAKKGAIMVVFWFSFFFFFPFFSFFFSSKKYKTQAVLAFNFLSVFPFNPKSPPFGFRRDRGQRYLLPGEISQRRI